MADPTVAELELEQARALAERVWGQLSTYPRVPVHVENPVAVRILLRDWASVSLPGGEIRLVHATSVGAGIYRVETRMR